MSTFVKGILGGYKNKNIKNVECGEKKREKYLED